MIMIYFNIVVSIDDFKKIDSIISFLHEGNYGYTLYEIDLYNDTLVIVASKGEDKRKACIEVNKSFTDENADLTLYPIIEYEENGLTINQTVNREGEDSNDSVYLYVSNLFKENANNELLNMLNEAIELEWNDGYGVPIMPYIIASEIEDIGSDEHIKKNLLDLLEGKKFAEMSKHEKNIISAFFIVNTALTYGDNVIDQINTALPDSFLMLSSIFLVKLYKDAIIRNKNYKKLNKILSLLNL